MNLYDARARLAGSAPVHRVEVDFAAPQHPTTFKRVFILTQQKSFNSNNITI